jgi:hypothetical protein
MINCIKAKSIRFCFYENDRKYWKFENQNSNIEAALISTCRSILLYYFEKCETIKVFYNYMFLIC